MNYNVPDFRFRLSVRVPLLPVASPPSEPVLRLQRRLLPAQLGRPFGCQGPASVLWPTVGLSGRLLLPQDHAHLLLAGAGDVHLSTGPTVHATRREGVALRAGRHLPPRLRVHAALQARRLLPATWCVSFIVFVLEFRGTVWSTSTRSTTSSLPSCLNFVPSCLQAWLKETVCPSFESEFCISPAWSTRYTVERNQ